MDIIKPVRAGSEFVVVSVLARLLERLERSTVAVGAEQYRCVVRRLAVELTELQGEAALSELLNAYPGAAELYENLQYRHAGLCRSPLDVALQAEQHARAAIARAKAQ